jgi:hypothetical protein
LNPKVIAGLAAVAVGVIIISPDTFGRALPLLIGLICPLSMVGMVLAMSRGGNKATRAGDGSNPEDRRDELSRLRSEVESLRQGGPAAGVSAAQIVEPPSR